MSRQPLFGPGNEPQEVLPIIQKFIEYMDIFYPQRIVPRFAEIDSDLKLMAEVLYKALGYDTVEDLLKAYGYRENVISRCSYEQILDIVRTRVSENKIEQEQESIAKRIKRLMDKLDEAYPEGDVSGFRAEHKKWGETTAELSKMLAYENADTFLHSLGYTMAHKNPGGRPTNNVEDVILELFARYPQGASFSSVPQLQRENPDLAGKIKTLSNSASKLWGMSLPDYLRSIGIFPSKEEATQIKVAEKLAVQAEAEAETLKLAQKEAKKTFNQLCDLYAEQPSWLTVEELEKKHPEIGWKSLRNYCKKLDQSLENYLAAAGIIENPTSEQALDYLVETLKTRLPRGRPSKGIALLKDQNPDLPFQKATAFFGGNQNALVAYLREKGILLNPQTAAQLRAEGFICRGGTNEDGPLTLVKYHRYDGRNVKVPEGIECIGAHAFSGNTDIQTVSLPNSLVEIEEYAFEGCVKLEKIKIPSAVIRVGAHAFENCCRLEKVDVPASLKRIGKDAFAGTKWLAESGPTASVNGVLLTYPTETTLEKWKNINTQSRKRLLEYIHSDTREAVGIEFGQNCDVNTYKFSDQNLDRLIRELGSSKYFESTERGVEYWEMNMKTGKVTSRSEVDLDFAL